MGPSGTRRRGDEENNGPRAVHVTRIVQLKTRNSRGIDQNPQAILADLFGEFVNLEGSRSRKLIGLCLVLGEKAKAISNHPDLVKIGV